MALYSVWGIGKDPNTLIGGTDAPRFADGTLDETCPDRIAAIEADDWEAAVAEYNRMLKEGFADGTR